MEITITNSLESTTEISPHAATDFPDGLMKLGWLWCTAVADPGKGQGAMPTHSCKNGSRKRFHVSPPPPPTDFLDPVLHCVLSWKLHEITHLVMNKTVERNQNLSEQSSVCSWLVIDFWEEKSVADPRGWGWGQGTNKLHPPVLHK